MAISTIASILMWLIGGGAIGVVFVIGFANKVLVFMARTEERLKAEVTLSVHFIKMGEDIKEQIVQNERVVADIRNDLKWLKQSQEEILKELKGK